MFVEGLVRKRLVAADAAGFEQAAVHMVDAVGAGALVEVVDVLGAEVEVFWICLGEALFDLCECFVSGVGLDSEGVAAALRVETPD